MGIKRRGAILILLVFSSLCAGLIMTISTTPAHEFGHYITAKFFGWNITEVNWFGHVAYTQDTIDDAPRLQKFIVSISGMIFAPIIPYVITVLTVRRSAIRDIVMRPYLGFGILTSCADLKKVVWYLLINTPMISTEDQILSPMNLMISVLAAVGVMYVLYMIAMGRYKQCVVELVTTIDELDDHDEEEQDNEE